MDDDDDDTHMEEAAAASTASTEFVPPSIDVAALLAGDSYSYFSPVPSRLRAEAGAVPCMLGVDEAGRGPVLGPMVYGVFYAPVAEADVLLRGGTPADEDEKSSQSSNSSNASNASKERYRFDDSKVLSASTRAGLMAALCRRGSSLQRTCGWATAALSARDIGADMLAPASAGGANLNAQAADATVALIRGVLARGVRVVDVYVDTVGPPATYQKKLERVFPGLRITVAKKADSLYPCVSAASVCAKVTRDVALKVLYRRHVHPDPTLAPEPDWGSGYPSDGRCTTWLRRNMHPVFGWGPECRFSWGTAKDLLEDDDDASSAKKKTATTAVRVEWPLPDDHDHDHDHTAARMTDFFVTSAATPSQPHADADGDVDELGSWFGRPVGLDAF